MKRVSFTRARRKILIVVAVLCLLSFTFAQQPQQRTFSSPDTASAALVSAVEKNDEAATLEILGSDAKQIVSSGDAAEDASSRATFVQRYREMHRFATEPDGSVVLYIGAHNWPTPIPLVNKGGSWYFDTDAGKREILFRRIGRNELSAIQVCEELVAAQKEYSAQHDGYAQKIVSDDGQHNGLYWKTANGEPQSPIGPLLAAAFEGQTQAPAPYRGYYFRLLPQQGKKNFVVIAYPAEYRSSGVMTFAVRDDGAVYQKDLGKRTEAAVKQVKEFSPARGWSKAETVQEEAADHQH